jgi:hypothetical protein
MHLSLGIILNRDATSILFSWLIRQQVIKLLVVNLKITDRNNYLIIRVRSNFLKNLMDCSRNYSTIFEIGGGSIHGESFPGTCLAVAHDSTVVTVDYRLDNVFSAV